MEAETCFRVLGLMPGLQASQLRFVGRHEITAEHFAEVLLSLLGELLLVREKELPHLRLAAAKVEAAGGLLEGLFEHLRVEAAQGAERDGPQARHERELV